MFIHGNLEAFNHALLASDSKKIQLLAYLVAKDTPLKCSMTVFEIKNNVQLENSYKIKNDYTVNIIQTSSH